MKGQSDSIPNNFIQSNGKTQVLYNITPVQKTDEQGTHNVYEYDYVEIEGIVTRAKVLEIIQKHNSEDTSSIIVPNDIFTENEEIKTNKDVIKTAYLAAISTLQNIQSVTTPTNAQVITGVKAEAAILEKLLKFMKSQFT